MVAQAVEAEAFRQASEEQARLRRVIRVVLAATQTLVVPQEFITAVAAVAPVA